MTFGRVGEYRAPRRLPVADLILAALTLPLMVVGFNDYVINGPRVLTVLGLLSITFGLPFLFVRRECRSERAVREWAAAHGWTYRAEAPIREVLAFDRLASAPFDRTTASATWVTQGQHRDRRCLSLVYVALPLGPMLAGLHQEFQVDAATIPRGLPTLALVPPGLSDRAKKALGGVDIEVGHAAFDKKWRVFADDSSYVERLLVPGMIERLMREDVAGFGITIEANLVLAWTPGALPAPDLERRLEILCDLADLIPQDLLRGGD